MTLIASKCPRFGIILCTYLLIRTVSSRFRYVLKNLYPISKLLNIGHYITGRRNQRIGEVAWFSILIVLYFKIYICTCSHTVLKSHEEKNSTYNLLFYTERNSHTFFSVAFNFEYIILKIQLSLTVILVMTSTFLYGIPRNSGKILSEDRRRKFRK